MGTKTIGVIVSGLDGEGSRNLYCGIRDQARIYGYSTISCMIRPSEEASREFTNGEYNLFEMTNYDCFDGLVVSLNSFGSTKMRRLILERIASISAPIIAINCDIPNSHRVDISNYEMQRTLVEHLICEHNYKKINYISGPVGNDDADERRQAYIDVMKEHNMYEPERIYHGTFFLLDGKAGLDYFEKTHKASDYDAIVCANDMSALSVMEELEIRGKRIPEDVAVTGVDDLEISKSINPSLTSVAKMDYELGKTAVENLHNIFLNKTVSDMVTIKPRYEFRGSCGCRIIKKDNSTIHSLEFTRTVLTERIVKLFQEDSISAKQFRDYVKVLESFLKKSESNDFLLCINDRYEKEFELENLLSVEIKQVSDRVKYKIPLFYKNGNSYKVQKNSDYQNIFNWMHNNRHEILATPIHFQNEYYGFVAYEGSQFAFIGDAYWEWANSLNLSVNNLHKRLIMEDINRKDSMTGLYNRLGMEFYWKRLLKLSKKNKKDICILFCDMDRLKYINDNFGHEEGDWAIKTFAQVFDSIFVNRYTAVRFGGDEFLGIIYDCDEEMAKKMITLLKKKLDFTDINHMNIRIETSAGYYIRKWDSNEELQECISIADERMYAEKCRNHAQRKE